MGEIIGILAEILETLKNIDLTKDADVKEIEKMGNDPLAKLDNATARKDFGEAEFNETVKMFGDAAKKVEPYNAEEDYRKNLKEDWSNADELGKKVEARKNVKTQIEGKYDELSKKKQVFEMYAQKYDANEFVRRQETKLESNQMEIDSHNQKIDENKALAKATKHFKEHKVEKHLDVIKANLELEKKLSELQAQAQKVADMESKLQAMKATQPAEMLKVMEEQVAQAKQKLDGECTTISQKYNWVTIDSKDIPNSITNARNISTQQKKDARIEAEKQVTGSEQNEGYPKGFEKFITDKMAQAKNEEEFMNIFDETISELHKENSRLLRERNTIVSENEKIKNGIQTLQRGEKVITTGTSGVSLGEPTDDEAKAYIAAHPEIKVLPPDLSGQDRTDAIYESLKTKRRTPFDWHPIAWLRSRYDKKAIDRWETGQKEDAEAKTLAEAKTRIKAERQEEEKSDKEAATLASNDAKTFRETLFTYVKSKDTTAIKQMEKDAETAPESVLGDIYDEIEDGR